MAERIRSSSHELLSHLIGAAASADFDEVDRVTPVFAQMDGDEMVSLLDSDTYNGNDDVRDGVMTAWSYLEIETESAKSLHFNRAREVMMSDLHECAAIWAAVTVCRYLEDERYGRDARFLLEDFKERIARMDADEDGSDWQETRDFVTEKTEDRVPQLASFI